MTMRPACAMNAEKLPTLPPTTMSAPLSEMPQRRDASPSMMSRPPCAEAPAAVEAKPRDVHAARHHVLGRARAGIAVHRDRRMLVHPRHVVAHMTVNLHLEIRHRGRRRWNAPRPGSSPGSARRLHRRPACAGTRFKSRRLSRARSNSRSMGTGLKFAMNKSPPAWARTESHGIFAADARASGTPRRWRRSRRSPPPRPACRRTHRGR